MRRSVKRCARRCVNAMDGKDRPIVNRQSSMVDRPAFTLIELLVVISIIALLLAVLMPVASRVRGQAKAAGCQANLRQWGLYYAMYTQDNDGELPIWWDCPVLPGVAISEFFTSDYGSASDLSNGATMRGYQKLLLCPTTRWQPLRSASATTGTENGTTRLAWSFSEGYWLHDILGSSYSLNVWFPGSRVYYGVSVPNLWTSCLVKGASDIPAYSDSRAAYALPYAYDAPPSTEDAPLGSDPMTPGLPRYAMDRHAAGINILFMDWSVRKVGIKELWTLKWTKEFERSGCWTKAGGVRAEDWPKWMRGFKEY